MSTKNICRGRAYEREFINGDCMQGMAATPDKYYDIAIVDPPYGIMAHKAHGNTKNKIKKWKGGEWDIKPNKKYFHELFRLSKNQIIWGANYFISYLKENTKWLVWDKMLDKDQSHFEIAWTSFYGAERIFRFSRSNLQGFRNPDRFHPCEKPIALYKWIVKNYVKPGWKILDTHVGSASSLIAYEEAGLEYVGYELDADYYKAAVQRIKDYRMQGKLFKAGIA